MSYFLLLCDEQGIPGSLVRVGETWEESIKFATEILKMTKVPQEDINEAGFEDGYFDSADGNSYYFLCEN